MNSRTKHFAALGLGMMLVLGSSPAVLAAEQPAEAIEATAQPTAAIDKKAVKKLDKKLAKMIGDKGTKVPGLGVIVYKDGQEVYSKYLGSRYIDNQDKSKNLPFTKDSRFRAASVSKQFTVFTLMQLAEEGKLDLDADISQYLGFPLRNPAYPDTPITVRMLASHTSSLRDGKVYSIPPQESVKEFFSPEGKFWENGDHFAPQDQEPGKYFKYCNLNYGLLGTIIERITGQRFDTYQKEYILNDLDIKADYVPGNLPKAEFAQLGTVYQKKDDHDNWQEKGPWYGKADDYHGIQPAADELALQNPYAEDVQDTYSLKDYQPGTNATMFSPQGGLRISCQELGHALEMLMNHGSYHGTQILSPASVDSMLAKQWVADGKDTNGSTYGGTLLSYGLGLYQIDGSSTARVCKNKEVDLVGHTGEAFGLLSGAFFKPGTKDGFVYIMNGEAVAEDDDPRSAGKFSGNYIWEENIMDAICEFLF